MLDLFNRECLGVCTELIFTNYEACHWPICALAAAGVACAEHRVMDKIHIEELEK